MERGPLLHNPPNETLVLLLGFGWAALGVLRGLVRLHQGTGAAKWDRGSYVGRHYQRKMADKVIGRE